MLKLAKIFSENAVVQQNQTIPIWGNARRNHQICCYFDGEIAGMTVSGEEGKFFLRIGARKGDLISHELRVEDLQSQEKVMVKHLFIGEVYLLAGQSNMEFSVDKLADYHEIESENRLSNKIIHYLHLPLQAKPAKQNEFATLNWFRGEDIESVKKFSGIGFVFGEELSKRNPEVKIGLIEAARGGTGIECFLSREALLDNPFWNSRVMEFDNILYNKQHYDGLHANQLLPEFDELINRLNSQHCPNPIPMAESELVFSTLDCDDHQFEVMTLPDSWTLANHNHAGIFWFRHEFILSDSDFAKFNGGAKHEILLSLGAIDKGDETFFNGELVGKTGDGIDMQFWNQNRVYRIPKELLRAGKNLIAIRVSSLISIAMDGGLIGPAELMFVQFGDCKISLAAEWKFIEISDFGQKMSSMMSQAGPGELHSQSMMFDNLIHPLVPYGLRGVLWYQGECNAINQADEYFEDLKSLICSWRFYFGQKNLNFIIIQLPGYQRKQDFSLYSEWAKLREAQSQAARFFNIPLVVTIDSGSEYDLHPTDKKLAGKRAAVLADELEKNNQFFSHSPVFQAIERVDERLLKISFNCFNSKLQKTDNELVIMLKTADSEYYTIADVVQISDDYLLIKTDNATQVTELYYNWSNYPIVGLTNLDKLPVAPFKWKMCSAK